MTSLRCDFQQNGTVFLISPGLRCAMLEEREER